MASDTSEVIEVSRHRIRAPSHCRLDSMSSILSSAQGHFACTKAFKLERKFLRFRRYNVKRVLAVTLPEGLAVCYPLKCGGRGGFECEVPWVRTRTCAEQGARHKPCRWKGSSTPGGACCDTHGTRSSSPARDNVTMDYTPVAAYPLRGRVATREARDHATGTSHWVLLVSVW